MKGLMRSRNRTVGGGQEHVYNGHESARQGDLTATHDVDGRESGQAAKEGEVATKEEGRYGRMKGWAVERGTKKGETGTMKIEKSSVHLSRLCYVDSINQSAEWPPLSLGPP